MNHCSPIVLIVFTFDFAFLNEKKKSSTYHGDVFFINAENKNSINLKKEQKKYDIKLIGIIIII